MLLAKIYNSLKFDMTIKNNKKLTLLMSRACTGLLLITACCISGSA